MNPAQHGNPAAPPAGSGGAPAIRRRGMLMPCVMARPAPPVQLKRALSIEVGSRAGPRWRHPCSESCRTRAVRTWTDTGANNFVSLVAQSVFPGRGSRWRRLHKRDHGRGNHPRTPAPPHVLRRSRRGVRSLVLIDCANPFKRWRRRSCPQPRPRDCDEGGDVSPDGSRGSERSKISSFTAATPGIFRNHPCSPTTAAEWGW